MKSVASISVVFLGFAFLNTAALGAGERAMSSETQAYIVAVDGNDENPGTQQNPWRTIQHAVDRLQAGETAYVRGGVYEESVVIEKSGAPDKYITLQNYPGEHPVIDPAFNAGSAILVWGGYIRIKGFEIRNCKPRMDRRGDIGALRIFTSQHCVAEGNTIHHIIGVQSETGGGKPAVGIHIQYSDDIVIQNNTVYDIVGHTESMGIMADTVSNTAIRRNLVYFCDKEGIRLLTWDRDSDNVIEGNVTLSNNVGIEVNMCSLQNHTTTVRNNFSGWNCSHGMQIKHTTNTVVTHNTIYGNHNPGLRFNDRPFNYYAVVKNNILSNNLLALSIVDRENFHETVDYDFYQYQPGGLLAWFDWSETGKCYSLADIRRKTAETDTIGTMYERHGKEGDPLFVNPADHDFRLQAGSPARGAADDGKDMGALESELVEVGADKAHSLAQIPDLGELKLRIESFSSETEQGRAANAVDGRYGTYWEVETTKDSKMEIVLALPGEKPHNLTFITLTKDEPETGNRLYRQFGLYVDDGSGQWKSVPESPEHPFVGYTSDLNNGETWALPAGTMARRVKVELVSGYGDVIRMPEIRVYAEKGRARDAR
jgi:hypothetical protein